MAREQPTLEDLAAKAAELSKSITSYLKSQELKVPSFAADSPNYPPNPEVQGPRMLLIETIWDMLYLAMGPADMAVIMPALTCIEATVMDVLNQFDFYAAVPIDGSASYADIARTTKLPESIVRRVLRYAMTLRLFAEVTPGSDRIVHTAATAQVARAPIIRSWVGHYLDENRRAMVELPASLRKFSSKNDTPSEDILESGFALADLGKVGYPQTPWDYFRGNKAAAKRFSEAMMVISQASSMSIEDILQRGFDWASLGHATVVDVGGSSGNEAIFLAQQYPNLTLVVQDLPEVEPSFRAAVPEELASRVTFDGHDFFQPQTRSADLFLLKMILHDWPDTYSVQILRNLIPMLKKGGRIIICDALVQSPKYDENGRSLLPTYVQKIQSGSDIAMLSVFNNKERQLGDWEELLRKTDPRLKIANTTSVQGALWSILEVVLNI